MKRKDVGVCVYMCRLQEATQESLLYYMYIMYMYVGVCGGVCVCV